ncbi:MAG: DUF2249 domain-containing protein [Acidiferrobacteraceae bacterium]
MASSEPRTLDLRDELRRGGEPLPRILEEVASLAAGQPLRLFTTFEPLPLYAVLGKKGFLHDATRRGEGDWEVLFTPGAAPAEELPRGRPSPPATNDGVWPPAGTLLDNRGLAPPEPMIRILEALEHLQPGEVLEAINEREPQFLYPQLEERGAGIRVDRRADGVHLLVRRGL